MKTTIFSAFMMVIAAFTSAAFAAERASKEEAKAMAVAAAEVLKAEGEASFVKFQTKGSEWHDRDLYVFVISNDGVMLSHGVKPPLVGRDVSQLKDVEGVGFIQKMIAVQDTAWIDYKWQSPETGKVEAKSSYVLRVGDKVVGVGAYDS